MLTVFYGDQVYGEYPDWKALRGIQIPDGAYAYDGTLWYYYNHGAGSAIHFDFVPAMCKAWMLIL